MHGEECPHLLYQCVVVGGYTTEGKSAQKTINHILPSITSDAEGMRDFAHPEKGLFATRPSRKKVALH